jgi:hypothetical protein
MTRAHKIIYVAFLFLSIIFLVIEIAKYPPPSTPDDNNSDIQIEEIR